MISEFIEYIRTQRRYSARTAEIYEDVLRDFALQSCGCEDPDEASMCQVLTPTGLRNHIVYLMEERKLNSRSVNQRLSVLSSLCRWLMHRGLLTSNPARLVTRPKQEKRLPEFYREESMDSWFANTAFYAGEESLEMMSADPGSAFSKELYGKRLSRLVVSILFSTGIRRAELISLDRTSVDYGRKVARVRGKGDKIREIPLLPGLIEEISLYLRAVDTMVGVSADAGTPLLMTLGGKRLYPVFVDRAVKAELGENSDITGRKSPHVLRHSLATGLLNGGTDLNSIKELLGHSSLAATQVYTHNSIEKLKQVYDNAHPRAKNGGNYGD